MKKGKTAFALCAGLLFSVWFSDVHFSFRHVLGKISAYGGRNSLVENRRVAELLAASGFTPGDFQAALPYPIPAEGSEKLWFSGEWLTKWSSLAYSCQTGTPVLGGILSRTSVSRTLQLMSLTGSDFSEKKIALNFPSDLPVLVIAPAKVDISAFLIKRSREIARNEEMTLYLLAKSSFAHTRYSDAVLQHFVPGENFYANTTPEKVLYWTSKNMGNDFSGFSDSIQLFDRQTFEINQPEIGAQYSMSCWIKVTPLGNKVPSFVIKEYDAGGRMRNEASVRADSGIQIDVSGNWMRFEHFFIPQQNTSRMVIDVHGENSIVDHFLLKPSDVHVVVFPEKMQGQALDNNFLANIYPGF